MKKTQCKKSEDGNYHPASDSWVGRDWWGPWALERPHTSKGEATTQLQQFIAVRTDFMILPRESRNRDFYMLTLTLVSKLILKYIFCAWEPNKPFLQVLGSSLFPESIRNVLHFDWWLCWTLERILNTSLWKVAWRIAGTGEPGGLPSLGSHRVGHDWSDSAAAETAATHIYGI